MMTAAPHFISRAAELAAVVLAIVERGDGVSIRALLEAGFSKDDIIANADRADRLIEKHRRLQ